VALLTMHQSTADAVVRDDDAGLSMLWFVMLRVGGGCGCAWDVDDFLKLASSSLRVASASSIQVNLASMVYEMGSRNNMVVEDPDTAPLCARPDRGIAKRLPWRCSLLVSSTRGRDCGPLADAGISMGSRQTSLPSRLRCLRVCPRPTRGAARTLLDDAIAAHCN
jgi:hypothetical protein